MTMMTRLQKRLQKLTKGTHEDSAPTAASPTSSTRNITQTEREQGGAPMPTQRPPLYPSGNTAPKRDSCFLPAATPSKDSSKSLGSSQSLETTSSSQSSKLPKSGLVHVFQNELLPMSPPPKNAPAKASSPSGKESCCDPKRTAKEVKVAAAGSIVYVDHPDGMARDEVERLKKKAVLLQMEYVRGRVRTPCSGQAGFVRSTSGGGDIRLVTVNHNVMGNSSTNQRFKGAYIQTDGSRVAPGQYGHCVEFKKDNLDEVKVKGRKFVLRRRGNLSPLRWPFGWDLTTAPLELPSEMSPTPSLRQRLREKIFLRSIRRLKKQNNFTMFSPQDLEEITFDTVGPDFKFEPGQKIAIVVASTNLNSTATPQTAYSGYYNLTQEQCNAIFGLPGGVAIYCGQILKVGKYHIEHDINTYNGCSGAIIILLDTKDQLPTVKQSDRGKAIAVHAGCGGAAMGYNNVGFKINKGAAAPLWYKLRLPQLPCFGNRA